MTTRSRAPLTIFGSHDQKTIRQIETCLADDRAVAGTLCADGHLGYSMPIGGVVAYEEAISPSGVGFDIACGNKAVRTNLRLADLLDVDLAVSGGDSRADIVRPLLEEVRRRVSFGLGRSNPTPIEHELFGRDIWNDLRRLTGGDALKQKAQAQLGTVGSGNHYVDLLTDPSGWLWVANHFGSRGLGHTIASGFLNLAVGAEFTDRLQEREEPTVLSMRDELGITYHEAMLLAGEYAYAGRDYVVDQVLGVLGAKALFAVHNHHNFAWYEDGRYVVRKGATPLTLEPAFVGGSMGDVSVIVRGKAEYDSYASKPVVVDIGALGSAPHGAGRVMSRTKAAGKLRNMRACNIRDCPHTFRYGEACPEHPNARSHRVRVRDPATAAIDWRAVQAELRERGIVVLGGGADEAPGVYKSLSSVLGLHPNIEIVEVLEPIGVVMAGADERDPYKD